MICDYIRVYAKSTENNKFTSTAKKLYYGVSIESISGAKFPTFKYQLKNFVQDNNSLFWVAKAKSEEIDREQKMLFDQEKVTISF